MKSWTSPTNDMVEKVLTSVKKETDRQYFFSKLENPLWVEPLRVRGYFDNPPELKQLPDGNVQYPNWPELSYLVNVAGEATEQVLEVLLTLPKTNNPRVYDEILSIALKLKNQESAKLLPKIIEYTELENQFLAHRYLELLQHWSNQGSNEAALEILKRIIPFRADPRASAKSQLRKQNSDASGTSLEPYPRMDQWEYQQMLELGVRVLAERMPLQTALILIDATAGMVQMGTHSGAIDKESSEDYSEIWCRRLDKSDRDYPDAKVALVHTLTYACEQVYRTAQQSIDALDKVLRKQRWKVFHRLRQLLYASHPREKTLPWIRESILGHGDYAKWEHHFEFQLMIRKACEHFGASLLNEVELSNIVEKIQSGPSRTDFRDWMGERYSDSDFQLRQRQFHYMQLRPFSALLSGDSQQYFVELENQERTEPVSDNSYSPYGEVRGGSVSSRSPKSLEELKRLTDEELLRYLNDWNDEHRDRDNWLVEITITALANVFQTLFKESIVPNAARLAYWMAHRDEISRPVYVAAMAKAMQELVAEKNFDKLNELIGFFAWILSHPDSKHVEGQTESREESVDHPAWGGSRRAVVDFIDVCVKQDSDVPIAARNGLAELLTQACSQSNWRLDQGRPILVNRDDPITEAINNTRSRALESLIKFGFWVRRHIPDDVLPEVTDILSKRLSEDLDSSLTRPEHAILGMQFGNLCHLNREWALAYRDKLFPREKASIWRDAFGSYLRFNRPAKATFEILREDFEFALDGQNSSVGAVEDGHEFIERLGQFLFTYYLWALFPLTGEQSLLDRFYKNTNGDRKLWARLFDHVGRSLSGSVKHLENELVSRAIAFFDWRLGVAEPEELQEFTYWLKAECLEPEWRLSAYSKILDIRSGKNSGLYLELQSLNELLHTNLPLVVECFVKIAKAMDQSTQLYLSADEAKPILRAGLRSDDPQVRENAKLAREKLLRLGRFDYLDVE